MFVDPILSSGHSVHFFLETVYSWGIIEESAKKETIVKIKLNRKEKLKG